MSHQFESGFFVNDAAWHGLGTVLENPPTTAEAIKAASLDWQVKEQAIFTDLGQGLSPVSTHKSLIRSTDHQLLGIVSKSYQPLQNQDAFNWFDFLLHDGDVSLETAGSLKEGKRIWVLAKVNQSPIEIIKDDPVEPYLLLSNSHDGSTAIWIQFTPIRVVCSNTLSYALSKRQDNLNAGRAFRIRHQGDIQSKLNQAQIALNFAQQQFVTATEEYKAMARCPINQADLDLYLSLVLKTDTPQASRAYPQIVSNFEQGRGNHGRSLWDAYNGVTEWLDYQRCRSAENRLESAWFGTSTKTRIDAHKFALELI